VQRWLIEGRERIYFDGFLPPAKFDTRLERLVKQTNQLSQYHSSYPTPCRSSFPPLDSPLGGPSRPTSVKPKLTSLPPSPFLVPAVLEALLDSSRYRDITEVVPGEADVYCAKHLNVFGGIVLTGDSDLLVHDLGMNGAVCFFKDIEFLPMLQSHIYAPAAIAHRLELSETYGLPAFAFELSMDSHGTFRKLLVDARVLKAAKADPPAFDRFLQEYTQLPNLLNSGNLNKILPLLRSLDPRISEYVLQYPYVAHIAGQTAVAEQSRALRVFLPFLLGCPTRTNAWEVSTTVRQLAYGLINVIVPEEQQRTTVSEHRKQQDKSSGRELQLPMLSQIPEACAVVVALLTQLKESLPRISNAQLWTAFAIYQEVEYSHCRARTSLSEIVQQQLEGLEKKSNMRMNLTWDIVHLFAQLQGSHYSFRILKQIVSLVISQSPVHSLPEPLLRLSRQLESLPKLSDSPGLDGISIILGSLGTGAISTITSYVTGNEHETASFQESRRSLLKKRKRAQHVIEASAGHHDPSNMYDLLRD
jgi:XPG domain containing